MAVVRGFLQRYESVLAGLLACGLAACVVAWRPAEAGYCLEARQRAAVARDMVGTGGEAGRDQSRGNQGLIGSLYLAPLPTVVVVLMGLMPWVRVTPFLCCVASALSAAGAGLYVHNMWRRHGVSVALRVPIVASMVLLPPVVRSVWAGETAMLFVALTVCGCGALVEWLRGGALRDLAVSGLALGLACLARYQGVFFAGGALVIVGAASVLRWRGWSFIEGTVITYAMPVGYAICLWVAGNWLILEHPFFFLRAALGPLALGMTDWRTVLDWDCPWLLLAVLGAGVLALPGGACLVRAERGGAARQAVAAAVFAAGCWTAVAVSLPAPVVTGREDTARVVGMLETRDYVNTTFVVSGYAGYEFVELGGDDEQWEWVHTIHLDPGAIERIVRDYPGRHVMLLVSGAAGAERWEDAGLSWLGEQSRIPEAFIYRKQIGPWTLFEVVRPEGGSG